MSATFSICSGKQFEGAFENQTNATRATMSIHARRFEKAFERGVEWKNKCNFCDYVSSQTSHLRSHLIIHTGEKPNECNQRK